MLELRKPFIYEVSHTFNNVYHQIHSDLDVAMAEDIQKIRIVNSVQHA